MKTLRTAKKHYNSQSFCFSRPNRLTFNIWFNFWRTTSRFDISKASIALSERGRERESWPHTPISAIRQPAAIVTDHKAVSTLFQLEKVSIWRCRMSGLWISWAKFHRLILPFHAMKKREVLSRHKRTDAHSSVGQMVSWNFSGPLVWGPFSHSSQMTPDSEPLWQACGRSVGNSQTVRLPNESGFETF